MEYKDKWQNQNTLFIDYTVVFLIPFIETLQKQYTRLSTGATCQCKTEFKNTNQRRYQQKGFKWINNVLLVKVCSHYVWIWVAI